MEGRRERIRRAAKKLARATTRATRKSKSARQYQTIRRTNHACTIILCRTLYYLSSSIFSPLVHTTSRHFFPMILFLPWVIVVLYRLSSLSVVLSFYLYAKSIFYPHSTFRGRSPLRIPTLTSCSIVLDIAPLFTIPLPISFNFLFSLLP